MSNRKLDVVTPPRKASEEIYYQLKEKILTGVYNPGERIPTEQSIMDMTRRSRPTVREALRMLEFEGMIVSVPGSAGAVVKEFTTESTAEAMYTALRAMKVSVREYGELRDYMCPQNAALAAERRTEEELENLWKNIQESRRLVSDYWAFYSRYEDDFYVLLAKASHNTFSVLIEQVFTKYVKTYTRDIVSRLSQEEREELCSKITDLQERVYYAVKNKDVEAARRLMSEKIVYLLGDKSVDGLLL